MRGRGPVYCRQSVIGTKSQTIWLKRGGKGQQSGSGPSGHKLRPAKVLARSLAAMASAHQSKRRD